MSPDTLAETLGALHWRDLAALGSHELAGLVRGLPDDVRAAHPRALVQAARAAERSADVVLREQLLEEALQALAAGPGRREAEAELAAARSVTTPGPAVGQAAVAVLAAADPSEHVARARALTALARVDAWTGGAERLRQAEEHLEEAVALLRLAREPEWEADALVALGYRVCFARGDLERAQHHLADALAITPDADSSRGTTATFHATVLAYAGHREAAERALTEADEIARGLGDNRLRAYAAWTWAIAASLAGQRGATIERVRAAERYAGPWFDHPTGAEFLADASLALGRVGEAEAARAYAEQARAHAERLGYPEIALLATGAVAARHGDPAAAERALVAYAESDQPAPREDWHILLLRAYAAQRAGGPDERRLAERAQAAAEALGRPDLPALHEPDIARALGLGPVASVSVSLLGRFAVSVAGRPVEPPPGRPATLVKLVALAGHLDTDEAIELLWPEADAATGRARLRNLLNRLRSACGELVERRDGLRLAGDGEVDAVSFERAAAAALAAGPADRPARARAAIAAYTGDLLPDDRFADWAAAPRERLRRRRRELLDALVDDAVERDDADQAIALLEQLVEAEPLDEEPMVRAAELLLLRGRSGRARQLVVRALDLRTRLGLEPGERLARLARRTGARPAEAQGSGH